MGAKPWKSCRDGATPTRYGLVILEATRADGTATAFNFGPAEFEASHVGHLVLARDVAVRGERVRHARTAISGGAYPIFGNTRTKTTLSGIHFDGPLVSAMIFIASSGATITGNIVTNVVPMPGVFPPPYDDISEGRGIKFLGNNSPDDITGRILIDNNRFGDMTADLSDAIVFDSVVNAHVDIRANQIHAVQESGIFLVNMGGTVTVTENDITPGPGRTPDAVSNGIDVGAAAGGRFTISGNTVRASNPSADGILIWGESPASDPQRWLVANNRVRMDGSDYGGVTVVGAVSGGLLAGNSITGTADLGIDLIADWYDPTSAPAHNLIVANDLSGFTPTTADVYLAAGTTGNRVIGHYGKIVDLGIDNVVTDPIRATRAVRHELRPPWWRHGFAPR